MEIPKKLKDEIWEFCHFNDITNVDGFIETMIKQGFNVEKYGTSPFDAPKEVEPPKPEVIEKIVYVDKEIIREVEIRVEVPVEKVVIKEVEKVVIEKVDVPVEKIVTITNDIELEKRISTITEELSKERQNFSTKTIEMENNFHQQIVELKEKLDVVVDEKYKGFWEEEIVSHDKTKEENTKLKDILNHLKGDVDNSNDIYGDQEKSKGFWGGSSNIKRKK